MVVAEKRFADPMPVAYGTIALLALGALLDTARLIAALTDRLFDPRTFVPHAEEHIFIRILTMIAFAIWIERIWRNLPALGEKPDTSRTWAVLSFFIPPFCFYRPVLVVSEAWSGSGGRSSPVPFARLATAWWVAFMTPIATILVFRGRVIGVRGTMVVAEFFNITAAGLAIAVVYLLSSQQKRAVPRAALEASAALEVAGDPASAPSLTRAVTPPPPAAPVAVTPASVTRLRAAAMVARVVNASRLTRDPLRFVDRVSPRTWQAALMFFSAIVAAALILAAAELHFERRDMPAALISCGVAAVLAAGALALRAQTPLSDGRRLAALSAAGAAITVVAFLAIIEGLLQ